MAGRWTIIWCSWYHENILWGNWNVIACYPDIFKFCIFQLVYSAEHCYTVVLLYLHSVLLECHQYLSPALIFKSIGDSICTSGEFSNIKPNIESCSLFLFSSLWEISKLSKGKFQGHRHRVVLGFHVFSDWPGIQDKFNMNTFLPFIFLRLIILQKKRFNYMLKC